MRILKITGLLLCLGVSFVTAQEVDYNNEIYTVKNNKVYKAGEEQTEQLTNAAKEEIITRFNRLKEQEEAVKKVEREQEKAKRKQKIAEKKLKKEKAKAKKIEKARTNLKKAESKLEKEQKRFASLQKKGKIELDDLSKWDEKLLKLKEKVTKAQRRLKRL